MSGLSVKLPIQIDSNDGYSLNKNFVALIRQNFRMLLLTVPGERIMNPDFGVGLKRYLFEQDTDSLKAEISGRINSQVSKYMDYIDVLNINIDTGDPSINDAESYIYYISIRFYVKPLNITEILNLEIS
jgi:phage baseplate assembly protein W